MEQDRNQITESLHKELGRNLSYNEIDELVQIPTVKGISDLTFPTFSLAKHLRKSPNLISQELADKIDLDNFEVSSAGGFLNFSFKPNYLSDSLLEKIIEQGKHFGSNKQGENKIVILDYSAPNIGKPLHVGHIRSTVVGDSLHKIFNFNGYRSIGINYIGDVGLHIGKIIAAFNLWGNKEKITQNPEKEILDLYVKFNKEEDKNPEIKELANQALRKIENRDAEVLDILQTIEDMSFSAFDRVYDLLDVRIDVTTGQSYFSDKGKEFVNNLLEKSLAKKDSSGAIIVNLDEYSLPEKVVLRSDGTAIYSTQDLGSAIDRKNQLSFDKMLYVVGSEQELYFKQVFSILDKAGYEWAKDCEHISFAHIHLPEGRMATREGNIIYLEEVLNKAINKADIMLEDKGIANYDLAKQIGVGALKYSILSVDNNTKIKFSWDNLLDFKGDSSVGIQYLGSNLKSLIKKQNSNEPITDSNELDLIRKIAQFEYVVKSSCDARKPNLIANYAFELSQQFPDILHTNPNTKLAKAYANTLENSLNLLGIKTPDGFN